MSILLPAVGSIIKFTEVVYLHFPVVAGELLHVP